MEDKLEARNAEQGMRSYEMDRWIGEAPQSGNTEEGTLSWSVRLIGWLVFVARVTIGWSVFFGKVTIG